MIQELRSYIKSQIAVVDPDMVQNDSAFYDDDIGETQIENTYQIVMNTITNQIRTNYREDQIECVVSIFGYGYQNEVDNYDLLLDKAICIRDNIYDLGNFSGFETIVNIVAQDITAQQLSGDNNGFKIDINLTIRTAYL
jgi:hypothetical protein